MRPRSTRMSGSHDLLFGIFFLALAVCTAAKLIPLWGPWLGIASGVAAPFAFYGLLRGVGWLVERSRRA